MRRVRVAASALRTGRASRRNGAFTASTCDLEVGELGGVPGRVVWGRGNERALYTMLQTPRPNSKERLFSSWQISRSSVNCRVLTLSLEMDGVGSVFESWNGLKVDLGGRSLAMGVTGGVRLDGTCVDSGGLLLWAVWRDNWTGGLAIVWMRNFDSRICGQIRVYILSGEAPRLVNSF